MRMLLKLFHSLWSAALLFLFSLGLAAGMLGVPASVVAYDGQAQGTIVYDEPSLSASGYDVAPALPSNERGGRSAETSRVFTRCGKFIAAYCLNNPFTYVDPSGHASVAGFGTGAIALGYDGHTSLNNAFNSVVASLIRPWNPLWANEFDSSPDPGGWSWAHAAYRTGSADFQSSWRAGYASAEVASELAVYAAPELLGALRIAGAVRTASIPGTVRAFEASSSVGGRIVAESKAFTQKAFAAAESTVPQVLRNQAAGNAARDAIAASRPGSLIEQNFRVTGGLRRVDVLDGTTAIESKVGRTGLGSRGSRVRQELARDIKLMRSGQVDSVEWHFSRSPTTGLGGPTGPLRDKLNQLGIPIVEY